MTRERSRSWARSLVVVVAAVACFGGVMSVPKSDARGARLSGSPEEVYKAFIDAMRAGDRAAMLRMLGPEGADIVSSGDSVSDTSTWRRFVEKYDQAHKVEAGGGKVVLLVGSDEFPLPIPLMPDAEGWRFDTEAGREEVLARRVGRNELDTIQVCLAYVDAQREYYGLGTGPNGMLQYAQKFLSVPGKHDGLYWPTKAAERPSPLGALVARARAEGYSGRQGADGQPRPFHGYVFRILTAQGPDAPGGAYNYVVRGHMIGGFAMVARPASYGDSGVMTFLVSHDGKVFQKDLGEATPRIVSAMKAFNPDSTWQAADTTLQK
ncbi:MAG TPA: DUF2950 domain-containing protein [Verrucomicrobiae bacterium]|jgi:DUF2950 family protein|nr:DUF2950 domain-containing protein [Verrucomicrobiae bacterium]